MDDQKRGDTPKARPEDAAVLAVAAQLVAIDGLLEAARGMGKGLLDAWVAIQLAPSTARLYRRVYGKKAPGSTRTKRLRKKRLRRLPLLPRGSFVKLRRALVTVVVALVLLVPFLLGAPVLTEEWFTGGGPRWWRWLRGER